MKSTALSVPILTSCRFRRHSGFGISWKAGVLRDQYLWPDALKLTPGSKKISVSQALITYMFSARCAYGGRESKNRPTCYSACLLATKPSAGGARKQRAYKMA